MGERALVGQLKVYKGSVMGAQRKEKAFPIEDFGGFMKKIMCELGYEE